MLKRSMSFGIAALVVVAGFLFAAYAHEGGKKKGEDGGEGKISMSQVPATVQKTIKEHADGGEVREIEIGDEDGSKVYEVEVVKNGKKSDFKVAEDGKFLGMEDEDVRGEKGEDQEGENDENAKDDGEVAIDLKQAPAAVQATIAAVVKTNPIDNVLLVKEDGQTLYEAEYKVNGEKSSVKMADNGGILEEEHGISVSSLPAAVLAGIQSKFPKADIKQAESVQESHYTVRLSVNGKTREIDVNAAGQIEEDDEGEEHEGKE